jgi:hypothetical protein
MQDLPAEVPHQCQKRPNLNEKRPNIKEKRTTVIVGLYYNHCTGLFSCTYWNIQGKETYYFKLFAPEIIVSVAV